MASILMNSIIRHRMNHLIITVGYRLLQFRAILDVSTTFNNTGNANLNVLNFDKYRINKITPNAQKRDGLFHYHHGTPHFIPMYRLVLQ